LLVEQRRTNRLLGVIGLIALGAVIAGAMYLARV
jgi:hypothetical protein